MNFSDPDAMNDILSRVLRYGVLLAAAILVFGFILLASAYGSNSTSGYLRYVPNQVPHSDSFVGVSALPQGIASLDPYSIIELGVIVLLATPVSRVFFSILLFAAERDRTYVKITVVVFILLLFSMVVSPLIPFFNA